MTRGKLKEKALAHICKKGAVVEHSEAPAVSPVWGLLVSSVPGSLVTPIGVFPSWLGLFHTGGQTCQKSTASL